MYFTEEYNDNLFIYWLKIFDNNSIIELMFF